MAGNTVTPAGHSGGLNSTETELDINACPGQVDFLKGQVKEFKEMSSIHPYAIT